MSNNERIGHLKGEAIYKQDNISKMFLSTATAMIATELTGVISVLMDGIITSRFLGVDAYSGISMIRPFTSMLLVISGFFSTGCGVLCSQKIGVGNREDANESFNLSALLALACAVLVLVLGFIFPTGLLRLCGVPLNKHPELHPYMYGYLRGYLIGVPAMILLQILGPILVLDNEKKLFTASSAVLGAANIAGDLLNVYVFKGGAFGMGVATSIGYVIQFVLVFLFLFRKKTYFRVSLKAMRVRLLPELLRSGSPALVKKMAGTLRDVATNRFNVILALTSAAIAAKGIQGDMFQFLFCIPTGLGRALVGIAGVYYSAGDRDGLTRLYSYALRVGAKLSGVAGIAAFLCAPLITRLYTADPETVSLTVFSIRCMSIALVFDTSIVLVQHYLQGTNNRKMANILSFSERLIVPVGSALILGMLYGSKGILVSVAVSKVILLMAIFIADCVRCKGLPKYWHDVMFLPEGFGGDGSDNMYAEIHSSEDVARVSRDTQEFCLAHGTDNKTAGLMSLFVEEMTQNLIDYVQVAKKKEVYADFRLFIKGGDICFSMMDLSDHFDPTLFYELNRADYPGKHIGIGLVMEMAKEVRYFSAFNSNNLIVLLDMNKEPAEDSAS